MTEADISELVELAWRDEVSFDAITTQTGLSESQVIALMRRTLKRNSFRLWRKRVTGRTTKHGRTLQDHSRHKTENLVKEYVRETDKCNDSPLAKLGM
jgi:uncharacterized protein (TIGR03643 family)